MNDSHKRRLFAVEQVLTHGKTPREVALYLGKSRASVCAWVAKFREGGAAALATRGGRGRSWELDDKAARDLVRQANACGDVTSWLGMHALAQNIGYRSSETSIRRCLQLLGYSYRQTNKGTTRWERIRSEQAAAA